jgi:hypothetical protein
VKQRLWVVDLSKAFHLVRNYATLSRIFRYPISESVIRIFRMAISRAASAILPGRLRAIYVTVSRELIPEDN